MIFNVITAEDIKTWLSLKDGAAIAYKFSCGVAGCVVAQYAYENIDPESRVGYSVYTDDNGTHDFDAELIEYVRLWDDMAGKEERDLTVREILATMR